jgi:hypothetical protein
MPDYMNVLIKKTRDGYRIVPDFIVGGDIEDLMVRGGAFYAVWDPDKGLWSRNEYDVQWITDKALWAARDELRIKKGEDAIIDVQTMASFSTTKTSEWKKYLRASPDRFHELDTTVTFASDEVKKEDYISKRLPYDLSNGPCPAYEKLISTLYSEEERAKIEWAVGSILAGDSVKIQKFIVLYGSAGTGKSTVLNIIQQLFEGYFTVFEAKALASRNNSFALEQFRTNPLVAIQHDGDLSRIADNTKLNSIVSHEPMMVNEKFKAQYEATFSAFLFMGSNKPVMITEAKSGLIRRLIDVRPTGNTLPHDTYDSCMARIPFELGAIAQHCLDVYKSMGFTYYDRYKPTNMFGATNDMYNFVYDHYDIFADERYVSLKMAWNLYKEYVEETKIEYPFSMRLFKAELGNYFDKFDERVRLGNGERLRNVYRGFKKDMFQISEFVEDDDGGPDDIVEPYLEDDESVELDWLDLTYMHSKLDDILKDCPAQYGDKDEKPQRAWDKVNTTLKDLDTHRLHYVQPNIEGHVMIDFDKKDKNGNKSMELNIAAARQFPSTYAELSKSEGGLHLHYIYTGDLNELANRISDDVEIKVCRGNASLRRRLTRCNGLDLAVISSGLPKKGAKKMLDTDANYIRDEKHLVAFIKTCLQKKHHGATTPEVIFIHDKLEECYNSGMHYDIRRLRKPIRSFCSNSTNQAKYCLKLFGKMKFCSDDALDEESNPETEEEKNDILKSPDLPPTFFDIEVGKNLLLVCAKDYKDEDSWIVLINPTPQDLDRLFEKKLWGFNNLGYDNAILYARYTGATNMECYRMSQDIIAGNRAINPRSKRISEGDLFDIAAKKQSLKKWEIEMGEEHDEMDIDWNEPIPEDQWDRLIEYCKHDVRATERLYDVLKEDIDARRALASFSGLSANERGRAHCTKIIFGNEKHPRLVYTDLATGERTDGTKDIVSFPGYEFDARGIDESRYTGKIVSGKSIYKGYDPGEGGFVYAEPGMHYNVALLDVASMHPTSMICENIFGDYTQKFKEIYEARLAIKHKDTDKLKTLLGGALVPYIGSDEEMDTLATALKLVINSVYGYTTATFENPFRDPRNDDNIVAKRGALFMIDLKEEVEKRGFKVAHIKTDSIKIPNATDDIIQFVMEFGKKYGYTFEHEATYERMCLMNDAVYIAKYDDQGIRNKHGKHAGEWTATGKQFQVPYVFKSLFSHEDIVFDDLCETRSVKTAMYLDMNEDLGEDEHNYIFVGRVGRYCPIKAGCGGGLLMRKSGDGQSYGAVGGTKGYRWLESTVVKNMNKEADIDVSYYQRLADDAINDISKFGDFKAFASGVTVSDYVNAVPFMNAPE